jgi:hypothetical protein
MGSILAARLAGDHDASAAIARKTIGIDTKVCGSRRPHAHGMLDTARVKANAASRPTPTLTALNLRPVPAAKAG